MTAPRPKMPPPPPRRAPMGPVLRAPAPEQRGAEVDWSRWYLDEDDMVESYEQGTTIDVLRSSLRELVRLRGWARVLIGADNYFAWVKEHPRVRISPDVYLLDDPPPPRS